MARRRQRRYEQRRRGVCVGPVHANGSSSRGMVKIRMWIWMLVFLDREMVKIRMLIFLDREMV